MVEIEVTESFIFHRTDKRKIYNPRGRTDRQFLMDLDAELYEHHMITTNQWEAHDDWTVDAIRLGEKIDVKFISKYYNLTPTKVCNALQQREILDGYLFCEWVSKPRRPLEVGDRVSLRELGFISTAELLDNVRPSTNYKDWGTSHYVNVRGLLASPL